MIMMAKRNKGATVRQAVDGKVAELIGHQCIAAPDGSTMIVGCGATPLTFAPSVVQDTAVQVARDVVRHVGGVFSIGIMQDHKTDKLTYAATWTLGDGSDIRVICPGHTIKQTICLTVLEMGWLGVLPKSETNEP